MLLRVLPDRTKRFRPSEVSDNWNDEILFLVILNCPEVFFGRQIAPVVTFCIGSRRHQRLVAPRSWRLPDTRSRKEDIHRLVIHRRSAAEERCVDLCDALL